MRALHEINESIKWLKISQYLSDFSIALYS